MTGERFNRVNFLESRYTAWAITAIFFIAGVILTFIANGTCDGGDSVMHYQFARWSWAHPHLFFDHWGKPFYTLVASPMAQFGIPGIKLFNLTVSAVTILITFSIARALSIRNKAIVALLLAVCPMLMVHALSGLTEPFFAFVLTLSVWLYMKDRIVWSLIISSFLPFVRSEGLMMCGVFALLLLLERKWRFVPLLAVGHVVYSIAGYFSYGTLLWVFTRIPYARLSSAYGKGTWDHFFVRMPNIIGIPLTILLVLGLLYGLWCLFSKKRFVEHRRELFLVYGIFSAYFFAHVIFWGLGIFNSYGLLRVLIGVLPMMALIQLRGLNLLVSGIDNAFLRNGVIAAIALVTIAASFLSPKYGWDYKRDFTLHYEQQMQQDMADYIKAHYPDYKDYRYYYDANFVSVVLDFDFFDKNISKRIYENWEYPPDEKCFLIWDEWYAAVEMNYPLEAVMNDSRFKLVKEFATLDEWGYEKKTVLFISNTK